MTLYTALWRTVPAKPHHDKAAGAVRAIPSENGDAMGYDSERLAPVDSQTAKQLEDKCQENGWLMRGGYDWQDDPYLEEYPYEFCTASDMESLTSFFEHGNWAIRQGVVFRRPRLHPAGQRRRRVVDAEEGRQMAGWTSNRSPASTSSRTRGRTSSASSRR
jgi:hypothetical protein